MTAFPARLHGVDRGGMGLLGGHVGPLGGHVGPLGGHMGPPLHSNP